MQCTHLGTAITLSLTPSSQSDTTGKLGFQEFKYLWNNIKKWQAIYKQFDVDRSGTIGSSELPGAFEAAGVTGRDMVELGLGLERQPPVSWPEPEAWGWEWVGLCGPRT